MASKQSYKEKQTEIRQEIKKYFIRYEGIKEIPAYETFFVNLAKEINLVAGNKCVRPKYLMSLYHGYQNSKKPQDRIFDPIVTFFAKLENGEIILEEGKYNNTPKVQDCEEVDSPSLPINIDAGANVNDTTAIQIFNVVTEGSIGNDTQEKLIPLSAIGVQSINLELTNSLGELNSPNAKDILLNTGKDEVSDETDDVHSQSENNEKITINGELVKHDGTKFFTNEGHDQIFKISDTTESTTITPENKDEINQRQGAGTNPVIQTGGQDAGAKTKKKRKHQRWKFVKRLLIASVIVSAAIIIGVVVFDFNFTDRIEYSQQLENNYVRFRIHNLSQKKFESLDLKVENDPIITDVQFHHEGFFQSISPGDNYKMMFPAIDPTVCYTYNFSIPRVTGHGTYVVTIPYDGKFQTPLLLPESEDSPFTLEKAGLRTYIKTNSVIIIVIFVSLTIICLCIIVIIK